VKKTIKLEKKITMGTVRKVMVTLNQIMAYAVRHRFIEFNPVRDAEKPKSTGKIDETHEMQILNPEQIPKLLDPDRSTARGDLGVAMARCRLHQETNSYPADIQSRKMV
jgi:site-specific recombinase XerD